MKKDEFIEKYGIEKYEKWRSQVKKWYDIHKKKVRIPIDKKMKRACKLLQNYRFLDKKYDRGECSLTVEDIYSLWEQGCHWCGETDWHSLGVDRIENTKPHTIDNVVCACRNCNVKRGRTKKVIQYTLDGEFVKEWKSITEISNVLGLNKTCISLCCKGVQQTSGGYKWKFKE